MGKPWYDLTEQEREAIRARGQLIGCHLQEDRGYYVDLSTYPAFLRRFDVNTMQPLSENDKMARIQYTNGDYLYD